MVFAEILHFFQIFSFFLKIFIIFQKFQKIPEISENFKNILARDSWISVIFDEFSWFFRNFQKFQIIPETPLGIVVEFCRNFRKSSKFSKISQSSDMTSLGPKRGRWLNARWLCPIEDSCVLLGKFEVLSKKVKRHDLKRPRQSAEQHAHFAEGPGPRTVLGQS